MDCKERIKAVSYTHLCVHVPTWRQDILRLADLAEEVARFYGYDKIPTTLPSGEATQGGVSYQTSICNMIRNVIESYGFSEGMTYSFESPKAFDKLLIPEGDEPVSYTHLDVYKRQV